MGGLLFLFSCGRKSVGRPASDSATAPLDPLSPYSSLPPSLSPARHRRRSPNPSLLLLLLLLFLSLQSPPNDRLCLPVAIGCLHAFSAEPRRPLDVTALTLFNIGGGIIIQHIVTTHSSWSLIRARRPRLPPACCHRRRPPPPPPLSSASRLPVVAVAPSSQSLRRRSRSVVADFPQRHPVVRQSVSQADRRTGRHCTAFPTATSTTECYRDLIRDVAAEKEKSPVSLENSLTVLAPWRRPA